MCKYSNKLAKEYSKEDIEIVIATMNRFSLDFLVSMFPNCHFSNFFILIINQTSEDNLLVSEFPTIRVINSFERGLSKSRNLALENSNKKIILISDDDEIFKNGFDSVIANSYNKYPKASVISFQVQNSEGELYRKYSKKAILNPNKLDLFSIFSPEISINTTILKASKIKFDINFGLGSTFQMAEEAIFLTDLKSAKQQIVIEPEIIAVNPTITTNDKLDFKKRYYIQGAFLTRITNTNYFFNLFLKLFFDLKQNKIKIRQIVSAMNCANKGRKDFRNIKYEIAINDKFAQANIDK